MLITGFAFQTSSFNKGSGSIDGHPPLGIFDFARKSFALFHSTDRSRWLALALDTLFWRVAATIVATAPLVEQRRRGTASS
jgi:hypothetical protein